VTSLFLIRVQRNPGEEEEEEGKKQQEEKSKVNFFCCFVDDVAADVDAVAPPHLVVVPVCGPSASVCVCVWERGR